MKKQTKTVLKKKGFRDLPLLKVKPLPLTVKIVREIPGFKEGDIVQADKDYPGHHHRYDLIHLLADGWVVPAKAEKKVSMKERNAKKGS